MTIGNRLECALALLAAGGKSARFADIGSDHAFLAVEAVRRGLAARAVAADINPAPLERGRAYARASAVAEVEFLRSDGFEALHGDPPDAAALCGLGGILISKILQKGGKTARCRLILQPMTAQDRLRAYLWENGFEIVEERFALENKRPYALLSARYTGRNTPFSQTDLYLGKTPQPTPAFAAMAGKVRRMAQKRLTGAPPEDEARALESLIAECRAAEDAGRRVTENPQ